MAAAAFAPELLHSRACERTARTALVRARNAGQSGPSRLRARIRCRFVAAETESGLAAPELRPPGLRPRFRILRARCCRNQHHWQTGASRDRSAGGESPSLDSAAAR